MAVTGTAPPKSSSSRSAATYEPDLSGQGHPPWRVTLQRTRSRNIRRHWLRNAPARLSPTLGRGGWAVTTASKPAAEGLAANRSRERSFKPSNREGEASSRKVRWVNAGPRQGASGS